MSVNHPLESEEDTTSDHGILQVDSILPRPIAFVWEVHEYLKTSKEGDQKMAGLLTNCNWASVKALAPNNDDMALEFHRVLDLSLIHI